MGNPQCATKGKQMPISFFRQVLALCELPRQMGVDHIHCSTMFQPDAISRAKELLLGLEEYGGIGSYIEPKGVRLFREHVASFIKERDGFPSNADDIFLTNGASSAIQLSLNCLLQNKNDVIMVPSYHYQIYSDKAKSMGCGVVEYALDKDHGWTITNNALEEAYHLALENGTKNVKCLCMINPGNPTGNVLSKEAISLVIRFCAKHDIVLLADEVYQENVYNDNKFISAKKIASSFEEEDVQLISFHSTSKGYVGECGRRGGYMELYNMPLNFHDKLVRLIGESLPCANTAGQIVTSLMCKPPRPNEASFPTFIHEKTCILNSYEKRAKLLVDGLNSIDGITSPEIHGAIYAFPSIESLPLAAIQNAEKIGIPADELYCLELLENTGILVSPASNFSTQKNSNCYGFRMSLLFHEDDVDRIISQISTHHQMFCEKYSKCVNISPPKCLEKIVNQIELVRLDHYTMICDNAKAVADYHVQYLGFKLLRTIHLNTGTVPEDEVDMLNYVLQPPGNDDMSLVVTEGKNDETIFQKYMNLWGAGIHHIAFEVEDIEASFLYLKSNQIKTTSESITIDMLSGLKQLFIDPCHAGFFIELIERPKSNSERQLPIDLSEHHSYFARKNMVDLANSMHSLLKDDEDTVLLDDESLSTRNCSTHSSSTYCQSDFIYDDTSNLFDTSHHNSLFGSAQDSSHGLVVENRLSLGPLRMIGFKVDSWNKSMKFLLETFNFRFINYDQIQDRVLLGIGSKGEKDRIGLYLQKVSETTEYRKAFVAFSSPDVKELSLSRENTIYQVEILSDSSINSDLRPVKVSDHYLHVHINRSQMETLEFLSDPRNLSQWTGHKSIHYSKYENSWVEIRIDEKSQLIKSPLQVSCCGDSVKIAWPHRNLSIEMLTKKLSSDITEVRLSLPSTLPMSLQCKIRRMIMIELNILKATLEGSMYFVPDSHFQQVELFHLGIFTIENVTCKLEIPPYFRGEVITSNNNENLFRKMSTDFAVTVHSEPSVILKPRDVSDIKTAIQIATDLGLSLVVRGSEISHSAGGQAQTDGGILLDISGFKELELNKMEKTIKIGAGCYWNDVVQFTLDNGFMPPVVNDYQYLSVGGTISMGGVGFMSHKYGIQAGHVKELEVVSGLGDTVRGSEDYNQDLYDLARCGLGQFGVVTSVTIPLVPAPKNEIVTLKFFYTQEIGNNCFVNDMKTFVDLGVDMIHSFLKPCKVSTITNIVDKELSGEFKETILNGEAKGEIVYFVELGIYDGNPDTPELSLICHDIKNVISSMNVIGKSDGIFESSHDFITYLRRDPPVISTNKSQGESIPHPSFATTLSQSKTSSLLTKHINSPSRGNDSTNEILIMPIKSNKNLGIGSPTPMFPLPHENDKEESDLSFFLLFLGSAIVAKKPDYTCSESSELEKEINRIRLHHRELYIESKKLGGTHYCYDTITSELKEEDWKKHYGDEVWTKIEEGKNKYDPFYLFRSKGVNLFD